MKLSQWKCSFIFSSFQKLTARAGWSWKPKVPLKNWLSWRQKFCPNLGCILASYTGPAIWHLILLEGSDLELNWLWGKSCVWNHSTGPGDNWGQPSTKIQTSFLFRRALGVVVRSGKKPVPCRTWLVDRNIRDWAESVLSRSEFGVKSCTLSLERQNRREGGCDERSTWSVETWGKLLRTAACSWAQMVARLRLRTEFMLDCHGCLAIWRLGRTKADAIHRSASEIPMTMVPVFPGKTPSEYLFLCQSSF